MIIYRTKANQPEFKSPEMIEGEALGILGYYKPKYETDLSVKLESYDFLTEFVPKYIKKTTGEIITVGLKQFTPKEKNIAAYSTYKEIVLNKELFDSSNTIENLSFNWTNPHESYHSIFHRIYLLSGKYQPFLSGLDIEENKQERIVTLNRDLNNSSSDNKTSPFCWQANIFTGFFLIPKKRMKLALKDKYGKDIIEFDSRERSIKDVCREIATDMQAYFDLNNKPLSIALENYNFLRDIRQVII